MAPPFRCAARLPGARAVWVIGAGRELFAAAARAARPGEAHPLDAHVERATEEAAAGLRRAGARAVVLPGHRAEQGAFPDLVAAARAAGLGWPSRLGLLLHPERGPWWSLRAALLTDLPERAGGWAVRPEGTPLPGAGPCAACPAPCRAACPGDAPERAGFDVSRCAAVRARDSRCRARCDARRACPVGAGHAYAAQDEARVMEASLAAVCARRG